VHGTLSAVEAGAKRLAQVVLGASHLAQSAVPALLNRDNQEIFKWKGTLVKTLDEQASFLCEELATCSGLQVTKPGGAMYTLVHIDTSKFDDTIQSDVDFSKALLQEENVFVLPGSCFGVKNVFRAVFCAPVSVLSSASQRIGQFCDRHMVQPIE
jgi:tyrosine aminotransferase